MQIKADAFRNMVITDSSRAVPVGKGKHVTLFIGLPGKAIVKTHRKRIFFRFQQGKAGITEAQKHIFCQQSVQRTLPCQCTHLPVVRNINPHTVVFFRNGAPGHLKPESIPFELKLHIMVFNLQHLDFNAIESYAFADIQVIEKAISPAEIFRVSLLPVEPGKNQKQHPQYVKLSFQFMLNIGFF